MYPIKIIKINPADLTNTASILITFLLLNYNFYLIFSTSISINNFNSSYYNINSLVLFSKSAIAYFR